MAASFLDLQTWDGSLQDAETWGESNQFALGPVTLAVAGTLSVSAADLRSLLAPLALGSVSLAVSGSLAFPTSNLQVSNSEFTLDFPVSVSIVGTVGIPAGTIGFELPGYHSLGSPQLAIAGSLGLSGDVALTLLSVFGLGTPTLAIAGTLGLNGTTGIRMLHQLGALSLNVQGQLVVSSQFLGKETLLPTNIRVVDLKRGVVSITGIIFDDDIGVN